MRVGMVGGGQLARMMALAGIPLGVRLRYLEPGSDAPASVCAEGIAERWDDERGWQALVDASDVVSYEVEHAPVEALRWIAQHRPVRPGLRALEVTGDRLAEKEFLVSQGIATAPFAAVDGPDDTARAVAKAGLPGILKTRTHGYDGKGQRRVGTLEELEAAARELDRPCVYEGFVTFERELSLIGVRGLDGEMRFWPMAENEHREGILWRSSAPAAPELQGRAEALLGALLDGLEYVGVLCVELFDTAEGLVANELAPRVHNSGHWTIEGAKTSQFENHLRAILGLPLGSTEALGCCRMLNCVGAMPSLGAALQAGGHVHDYGKAPRPKRKLGHVTICEATWDEVEAREVVLGDVPFG